MRQPESRCERPFDAVLGDCLDALLAGADVEYCLRRWPEYADELEPLLRTAAEVQQTPPLAMSDAGFRRGRQRVRDAAAALRNGRDVPVPHHVPMDDWPAPPPQTEPVQRGINWFEVLALAAVGAALVILLIFSAPPDSPLYPLRSSAQRALAWLQGTPEPAEVVSPRMTPSPTLTGTPLAAETPASPAAVTVTPSPRLTTETSPAEMTPAAQDSSVAETPVAIPSTLQLPSPTSTPTQAPTFTAMPVVTPTSTSMPAPTGTATRTPTATETPRPTATPTATSLPTDTPLPTATVTPAPTVTPSLLPSPTPAPTQTPTITPTRTRVPTALPTATSPVASGLPELRLEDEVQLTRREYAVFRAWSPDGARILFSVPRPPEADGGDWGIWVMKRDGSAQRELAAGRWPIFSPDGQRVAYVAGAGDDRSVWVVSVLGGEPQRIAEGVTGRVFWPADDTLLYATAEGLRAVTLTPTPTGTPGAGEEWKVYLPLVRRSE